MGIKIFLENDEIKFTVLFTLKKFETPILPEELYRILTWENEIIDYFTLTIALSELKEDGYIEDCLSANLSKLRLTFKGDETSELFSVRVPRSLKDKIAKTVGSMKYETLVNPSKVEADFVPLDESQYLMHGNFVDEGVPLLEIKLYAGGRDKARGIAEYFKKNPEKIYSEILNLFSPSEEISD